MKARKQLPSWLQAIWNERVAEMEKAQREWDAENRRQLEADFEAKLKAAKETLRKELYAEAVKQCNEIMSQNSSDCMNRCLNLIMMACKSIGLSPRTGQRIGKELDTYILPKWGFYAQTGDGDFAFAHELEEAGYPVFETNGKL